MVSGIWACECMHADTGKGSDAKHMTRRPLVRRMHADTRKGSDAKYMTRKPLIRLMFG